MEEILISQARCRAKLLIAKQQVGKRDQSERGDVYWAGERRSMPVQM